MGLRNLGSREARGRNTRVTQCEATSAMPRPGDDEERDDGDDIPDTPTDEPPPEPIEDPPAEPGPQGPYIVE